VKVHQVIHLENLAGITKVVGRYSISKNFEFKKRSRDFAMLAPHHSRDLR